MKPISYLFQNFFSIVEKPLVLLVDRIESQDQNDKGQLRKYVSRVLYFCLFLSSIVVYSHVQKYNSLHNATSNQLYSKFELQFNDVTQRYFSMMYGVRAVFSQNPGMTLQQWRPYAKQVLYPKRYPGIADIAFVTPVLKNDLKAFLLEEQQINDRNITIRNKHQSYDLNEYNVVKYNIHNPIIDSVGTNLRDINSIRRSLDFARDEDKSSAVYILTNKPELSFITEPSFFLITPVFDVTKNLSDTINRRQHFIGWVTSTIHIKALFITILRENKDFADIHLDIFFPDSNQQLQSLHPHDNPLDPPHNDDITLIHSKTLEKNIANLNFKIILSRHYDGLCLLGTDILFPKSGFLVLFICLMISFLVTSFVWSLMTMRQRAVNLANRMTTDLFRQEQKYRSLIQNAPGVIFSCDPKLNWRMDYLSDQFRDITGYDPKDFLENKRRYIEIIHPEDILKVEKTVGLTPKANYEYFLDYRIIHANGTVRWMHERAKVVRSVQKNDLHLTGHFFDITDQKNKESEYRNLVNALENAVNGVAYINSRGYHLQVNESYSEIVEAPPHVLQYKSIFDFFGEGDQKKLHDILDKFDDQRRETITLELRSMKDRIVYVQLVIVPAYSDDIKRVINGFYIFTKDVSREARREMELSNAVKSAEAANQTKSTFLATMSHELRTPLNAIIGYSDMLIEDAVDEGNDMMVGDLRKINTSGRHLLTLINDILDVSKLEAGKTTIHLEAFSIQEVSQSIIDIIYPSSEKNNNKIVLEIEDDIGDMYSDLTKIRQMVFNLLSNACKFTKDGTVTLRVSSNIVQTREFVTFCVTDTGIGIKPESMNKLFQPFTQADSSTTRNFGGTGLGLIITKKFTEILGGNICFSSTYGKGTEFSLNIPRSTRKEVADKFNESAEKGNSNSEAA